ncbi:MAG TPA: cation-translocating P-type ATPase, partial [Candidatus Binatia bacterium]|nr:cation-translocating P-type ATPase [Candidatus Binatia bacterium]
EPMFLLLIAAALIYLALGDVREALILAFWIVVIIGITIFQERKTERALEALRDLSSPRALVIRDGDEKRIAGREVVRDDCLIITEGDRVPADALLLSCNDLMVDESLLTGESVPVRKAVWDGVQQVTRPGGDDLPFVFAGTMLVQGRGVARVVATGARTEMGHIGKALQAVETDETYLQRKSGNLIRNFATVGLSVCALVVALYGLTRESWINGFLVGIALAMALLPEEIPVVLTIFLALGAWRMSQRNVLTRRMPAIESLGAATILCADKTGTLTLNRMTVKRLCVGADDYDVDSQTDQPLPQKFHRLVRYSVLASETDPFDPMEKAFKALGDRFLDHGARFENWTLAHEYSISPELLALSHVWHTTQGDQHMIATKGAPEAVADLCHFNSEQMQRLSAQVDSLARDGLRVLAVARARFDGDAWPPTQHDFDFDFLGLIGLADPVRPAVPPAIRECAQAGIKVVMITGDYPSTAQAVGRAIGLAANGGILTGPELAAMHEGELRRRIPKTNVFARVLPEQKLNLVEAFKANGEIVAMTGDGVNDAPALKAAHIGIAMGGRGTDVAREAASLVLLDDDFATIVEAIRSGRRIFDNLQKAMSFIFAIHVPIAGLALIPLILDWPLVLTPVHIVFLELIIDPACSIAFEAEPAEANIMQKPPREPDTPLLGGRDILYSLLQGSAVLAIVLLVFGVALYRGQGADNARALTFSTLVLGMLGLISANRSWSRQLLLPWRSANPAFWWVISGALGFLAAVLYIPSLSKLFRFTVLHPDDLAVCFAAGVISFFLVEIIKRRGRKNHDPV